MVQGLMMQENQHVNPPFLQAPRLSSLCLTQSRLIKNEKSDLLAIQKTFYCGVVENIPGV